MSKKTLLQLALFFLIWRVSLFVVGSVADNFLTYAPTFPYAQELLATYDMPRWLYSWANFDGVHYLTIAEKGYIGTGLIQAFFPGFPLTMMGANFLLGNTLVTGLLLANFSTLLLMMVWYGFVSEVYDQQTAKISLLILFLFPTAFFFGAVYSEALFLALIIGSFWAARRRQWWLAGILAAVASATRVVGVGLVPALLLELYLQLTEQKSPKQTWQKLARQAWPAVVWIAIGTVGLLAYMWFLYGEFRDALYFLHVQSEFGGGRQESLVLYPQVVWRYIKILLTYRPFNLNYLAYVQEFVAGTVGLLTLVMSYRQVRWSYLLFALGAFIVPTLTGTFSSMPRYILVCFPLFIWLTLQLQNKRWLLSLYLVGSIVLLFVNLILFIQGYWIA
ncbi:MAG TPA: mannosyltransferase family protein [Vitreimonas sp.]|nr:mannosyltransferase family protein [Vitreimonas sp.]